MADVLTYLHECAGQAREQLAILETRDRHVIHYHCPRCNQYWRVIVEQQKAEGHGDEHQSEREQK